MNQPNTKPQEPVKAAQDDLFERPVYKVGDGDHNTYVPRPGSLRAFTIPSKGMST